MSGIFLDIMLINLLWIYNYDIILQYFGKFLPKD